MTKEEYREALLTKEWKDKRKLILERDGHCCTKCPAKKHLQVHHIHYIAGKMPWEVPNTYLTTLCKSCHDKEHKNVLIYKFILSSKKKKTSKKLAKQQSKKDKAKLLVNSKKFKEQLKKEKAREKKYKR